MSETSEKVSKKLLEQLKDVNCQLLGSREESWLCEVLFSSSENHNQFLKWILCSFDESLAESLENMHFQSLSIQEQEKQLHNLCFSSGFCKENDLNIINGTAGRKSIEDFWEVLLGLHLTHVKSSEKKEEEEDDEEDKEIQFKFLSGVSKLESSSLSNDSVSPKTTDHLSPTLNWKLLPPNLEHEAAEYAKAHSVKSPTKERITEILAEIEKKHEQELELKNPQALHEEVKYSILQLRELTLQFIQCHQQMQPWLKENVQKPEIGKLQTLVKKASEKMTHLEKVLDAFQIVDEHLPHSVTESHKPPNVNTDGNSHVIKTLNETIKSEEKK